MPEVAALLNLGAFVLVALLLAWLVNRFGPRY